VPFHINAEAALKSRLTALRVPPSVVKKLSYFFLPFFATFFLATFLVAFFLVAIVIFLLAPTVR
jgi:hypothetical protein